MKKNYVLSEGVSCIIQKDVIRIRRGIWNYQEIIINMTDDPDNVKHAVEEIFQNICKGTEIDYDKILKKYELKTEKAHEIRSVIDMLVRERYVIPVEEKKIQKSQTMLLLGQISKNLHPLSAPRSVAVIGDDKELTFSIVNALRKYDVMCDELNETIFNEFTRTDMLNSLNPLDKAVKQSKLVSLTKNYDIIVEAFIHPNIVLMRILNRLALISKKVLVFGILDGPFLMFGSLRPPYTACWECVEMAMLVHLSDHVNYQEYAVSQTSEYHVKEKPIVSVLIPSFVVPEAFLISQLGFGKLMGSLLAIFVPSLELQTQRVSRIPYCPACSAITRIKMKELYFSSYKLIEDLLKEVKVDEYH